MSNKINAPYLAQQGAPQKSIITRALNRLRLNPAELSQLKESLKPTATNRFYSRANLVITLAKGDFKTINHLATAINRSHQFVKKWLEQYVKHGVEALKTDAPRSGRPSLLSTHVITLFELLLPLQPKALTKVDLFASFKSMLDGRTHWTRKMLACVLGLAQSTIGQYVKKLNLGYFSTAEEYCFSTTDPNFFAKVLLIDLLRRFGEALGFDVWSFDEKTCIQAISRDMPLDMGGRVRLSDRYERNGTTHLLAVMRPATGYVFADMTQHKTADDLKEFIRHFIVAHVNPDRPTFLIMDNIRSHDFSETITAEFPNVTIVFTPTNSSWINPVEGFFGVIQSEVLNKGNFTSVEQLESAVLSFIDAYNLKPHPYKWELDIARLFNQRLNTIAALKRSIPDFEIIQELAQDVLSTEALAFCKYIDDLTRIQDNMSYDGLELFDQEAMAKFSSTSVEQPHCDSKPIKFPVLPQHHTDELTSCDSLLSQEVLEAYESQDKALDLIMKLLHLLPTEPHHKEPEFKLTQAKIDSKKADLDAKKKELESLLSSIKMVNDWETMEEAVCGNQKLKRTAPWAKALKEKLRKKAAITEQINSAELKLAEMQNELQRRKEASKEIFDSTTTALLNQIPLALKVWCDFLGSFRSNRKSSVDVLAAT